MVCITALAQVLFPSCLDQIHSPLIERGSWHNPDLLALTTLSVDTISWSIWDCKSHSHSLIQMLSEWRGLQGRQATGGSLHMRAPGSWQSCAWLVISAVLSSRFPFQLTNDIVLISYLATVTKGCDAIGEYVQKLNTLYDHHGILRRTRGSLFWGERLGALCACLSLRPVMRHLVCLWWFVHCAS